MEASPPPNSNGCANCGAAFKEPSAYCPECGQHQESWLRPFGDIVRELLGEWFDVDGRIARSLKALLIKPGLMTQDYLHGRRKHWSSPVRMYLLVSLLFFLVLPLILPSAGVPEPGQETQVDNYSRAMFVLLPVFALLMKLFYPKQYYTGHLVFSMHGFSAMFIAFGFMLAIESLADRHVAALIGQLAIFAYMLAYSLLALRRVYGESWSRTALKFAGLFALFLPVISAGINLASLSSG